jgi:diguanylate cyclase (GGDEF)-like protein
MQTNSSILEALTTLTTSFAPLKGEAFYQAISRYIVEHFEADYAFVGRLDKQYSCVDLLAGWQDKTPMKPFQYDLRSTPCEDVIKNDLALYSNSVQKHFPKDQLLKDMNIEAYGGIVLFNKAQDPIGILVLLSKYPFQESSFIEHILKIYAGSLSAEIERYENEQNTLTLQNIAYYDPLTKLPNRLLITDRIRQAIKNQLREHKIVAICLMDLDGFKSINDTLGHSAGDHVLIETSRRIENIIHPKDTIARLGGDEFVLVLTQTNNSKEIGKILLQVLHKVAQPYNYKNQTIESISASIGVTIYPEDHADDDTLLRHADQAMYKAKENGKNQFYFFDTKEHQKVKANFKALQKIEKAIKNGEFELYFQPKLSTHSFEIESAEVLTRWNHPILERLSPNEFLPLIEHDDLIYTFDQWVIGQSLKRLIQLHHAGYKITLSINISAKQFKQKGFIQSVKKIAHSIEMDFKYFNFIEFEITENSALESINHTNETIKELRKLGINFALDDFGTGYSSLTHLRELHINAIKIDKSFIFEMLHNTQDMAIVNAIISLSKVFQIDVIAEGVENIEQLLMLIELGCDAIQGYRIAKPMSFKPFIDYLEKFQPDPRWQVSFNYLPRRADFELLLAQSNHKYWIEVVLENLKNRRYNRLPQLSSEHCRLGKWLKHRGKEYFCDLPSFDSLLRIHQKSHQTVQEIVDSLNKSGYEVSQVEIDKIFRTRDELILAIERLKEEYRNSLSVKGVKYVK